MDLALSNMRHFQAPAPLFWGQVFAGSEPVEDSALAYDLSQQGFSIDYERDYRGCRPGLLGGVVTNSSGLIAGFGLRTTLGTDLSFATGIERSADRLDYQLSLEYAL